MNISFIIPTRNNLPYLELAYRSIRRFYPKEEILILDDNSTDRTKDFLGCTEMAQDKNFKFYINPKRQVGHTVLYDEGVAMASNDIFTIFHADMVCGPNYVENLLKWLKPRGVVAATRIEPPLHPPGKEKIVKDFGIYPTDFKDSNFYAYCRQMQDSQENKGMITRGIFAPWAMYKEDFQYIGGHDKLFSPFPYEDSDIFQRMILAGYEINQSRDAFVYHFTCRGHRWTKEIQKDDLFYKLCCGKNMRHFIRKWGSWIENDENCYPTIPPKYDIGFVVKNCPPQLVEVLEPWCSTLYCHGHADEYVKMVQPETPFDITKRVKPITYEHTNDILVHFDGQTITNDSFQFLTTLPKVLKDSGEVGLMQYEQFNIIIKHLNNYERSLVRNDDLYYINQLLPPSKTDPYCTDSLFKAFEAVKPKE